jgi:ribosome maturation factor RimP
VPLSHPQRDPALLIVEQAVRPVLDAHGVDLFEATLRRERDGWVLRLVIEPKASGRPAGVSVDLCAEVSRDASVALDVADPIPHAYTLEVSSPGAERPLRDASDYARFAGLAARVVLVQPLADGRTVVQGVLAGVGAGGALRIQEGDGAREISLGQVKSAHLVLETRSRPKPRESSKRKKRPRRGR